MDITQLSVIYGKVTLGPKNMTPFFRMDLLLYHKFEYMVIFGLYSLCRPKTRISRNLFSFNFLIKNGRNLQRKILLEIVVFINES